MTTTLIPQLLDVGLSAIQLASGDGIQLRITHVALGDAGYVPNAGQSGLRHEVVRYPVADGHIVGPRQLHLTALADDSAEFWVREVGFILESGVCLAVWSDPNRALAYKQGGLELLLAYDLTLAGVPPDSVTVQSTGAGLNLHLAEELASLASAQIVSQLVDLQQDAQLASLRADVAELAVDDSRATAEHAVQLVALAESNRKSALRLDALSSLQAFAHDSLLEVEIANSAALIQMQTLLLQGAPL
ncbi:phage tail-collar fiber domain-containing protein [Chromobacterium haemolyticum]|uniref:Phage tail protein n=1 Tax=Chromobacterium haemolyticum TaxID=394935 RepID=A0A1W0CZ25_9NEIS|nr:phage tail protein [Chromobacterium haemolyticum]OQS39938.1 phage tail protein [Chromobacterium haemolyticum]